METTYYNPKSGKVNYKAIEKAVGHKLDYEEREYAIYYYESGNTGLPDFDSEAMSDFCLMLKMKPTTQIEYNEEMYPVFFLPIHNEGEIHVYSIGTESLQDALLMPNTSFRDDIAQRIDEKIFFYIPDKLADATEREIISFIENNLN